jgi:hypothetical protein
MWLKIMTNKYIKVCTIYYYDETELFQVHNESEKRQSILLVLRIYPLHKVNKMWVNFCHLFEKCTYTSAQALKYK